MDELKAMIAKYGTTSVLLVVYEKLVDEMLRMPTETLEQCEAMIARHAQLALLYKEATGHGIHRNA